MTFVSKRWFVAIKTWIGGELRIGVSNDAVAAVLAGLPVLSGVFDARLRWIRLTLHIKADASIIDVTRNSPRTGNLPWRNGCLIDLTVDSTAARGLRLERLSAAIR